MTITERIDAITKIAPEYLGTILPAPKSVKIELTGRCNYSCSFCARSLVLRDQQDMSRGMFERLALEMRKAGVEELGLFYLGESMMCAWLEEAVKFAKREAKFDYVFLTTNGSLAKPQRLRKLFYAGLDSLKFSLNYADEQQFIEIARSNPKLFDIMISNIKDAKLQRDIVEQETGHNCGLYASYIQYDGEQAERMAEMVKDLTPYLDEIYALPLYSQAELVGASERDKGWNVTAGNRGRMGALRDPIPCWATMTEGHITHDGKLSACCFDHDGRFEMGDLTTQTFMEAWNSSAFQSIRQAHLNGDVTGTPCETCVVAYEACA
jgi:radical SAM protein with 4Fe4S-binding SPASM domain